MDIVQFAVSILLFFVLFFGISFLLNMVLRMSWFMLFVFPLIVLLIVDDFPLNRYFREPVGALSDVWSSILALSVFDIIILLSGFLGTLAAGIVIRLLRKNGYQMF
ncbi:MULTISPECIES: YuiB family protein [Salimicrobium]|uniref:Membrane protein n=2 Tax=Salimicrobium TaxID=351195 RepID=A0ABY1KSS9_9BACI|nr:MULTISPECIES: YuiB family protein [Salimicrobium]SDY02348.1 Putative membrane protein [Salimicrobium album]SIS72504.1 Putative membrane protein [Salimicrobium salexigens]